MPFDAELRRRLVDVLGEEWVKDDEVTLYSYRCDGLTLHSSAPKGVLFPANRDQVVAAIKLLNEHDLTYLARGAGTGLSGGAIPHENSVIIEMARMKRIFEVDPVNRTIVVEPGVVNIRISEAIKDEGLCFVPDPSSQKACTIGGNVAENSGGPHTLKYGVTVNHILGLEVVLPSGECVEIGGDHWGTPGPDVLGLFIGSEGTFGIVTKITCRLMPLPEKALTLLGAFSFVEDACRAVSGIISKGIVPAALELIDKLVIEAVEQTIKPGFPTDAEAVLIIELEDLKDGLDEQADAIGAILKDIGVKEIRVAQNEDERALIWKARKQAFGAIGKLSPSYYTQDGVIPRSALPQVLGKIIEIGKKHRLRVANVFHAGDGNLHPLILYNALDSSEIEATHQAGQEILQVCLESGGSLSGEHGIGLEKSHMMDRVFSEDDLKNMEDVRRVFNPHDRLNPGKILPHPGKCAEMKMVKAKSGVNV